MIDFMNNFIRLENSNLLVLIDVNYGGKIVKLINKDNGSNWVWFNDSKYSKFSPTEFSDYDSQWIGVMKNYILMIRLNLLWQTGT